MSTLTHVQRQRLPLDHFGDPVNRSFVVQDQGDLNAVAGQLDRARDPGVVQARVTRIARTKGLKLPDSWRDPRIIEGRRQLAAALARVAD